MACCNQSTNPLAHFPFSRYLGFCEFAKTQTILGHAARGARLSGLSRDGSELDRPGAAEGARSEEHTSELQSRLHLVCRLLLEKKKRNSPLGVTESGPRYKGRVKVRDRLQARGCT